MGAVEETVKTVFTMSYKWGNKHVTTWIVLINKSSHSAGLIKVFVVGSDFDPCTQKCRLETIG